MCNRNLVKSFWSDPLISITISRRQLMQYPRAMGTAIVPITNTAMMCHIFVLIIQNVVDTTVMKVKIMLAILHNVAHVFQGKII